MCPNMNATARCAAPSRGRFGMFKLVFGRDHAVLGEILEHVGRRLDLSFLRRRQSDPEIPPVDPHVIPGPVQNPLIPRPHAQNVQSIRVRPPPRHRFVGRVHRDHRIDIEQQRHVVTACIARGQREVGHRPRQNIQVVGQRGVKNSTLRFTPSAANS